MRPQKHTLPHDNDVVVPDPIERHYAGLKGCPLKLSRIVPASERRTWAQDKLFRLAIQIKPWFPLRAGYPVPYQAEGAPYPKAFVRLMPAPQSPQGWTAQTDKIADIAQRGPFSILTRKTGEEFQLDMTHLEQLTPEKPFLKTGGRARLKRIGPQQLQTLHVALDGQVVAPDNAEYDLIERRFLTGIVTHVTYIEHLIFCHLILAEQFALATHSVFATRHPLRILVQPFIRETVRVNTNIDGLILNDYSNVPSYTGIPLRTLYAVLQDVVRNFDIRILDPVHRAEEQGTRNEAGFHTLESLFQLFSLFRELCSDFCHNVLKSVDLETLAWCKLLDEYIPNGIRTLLGISDWTELTLEHLSYLLAVCTYTTSVAHHLVADRTRDYFMTFQAMAPAIADDGLPQEGMVIEKMNSIMFAGALRYRLLDPDVPMPGAAAQEIWKRFQNRLQQTQAAVEADGVNRFYRIEPQIVPSSVHA
jgi:hypothetical protein